MRFGKPSVFSVLARQTKLDALSALTNSLGAENEVDDISDAAIGVDSSVFLGLVKLANPADVVDSLGVAHSGPLILPGQAIQEFWNNQAAVVETFSTRIKNKFDQLKSECEKLPDEFGDFPTRFADLLTEFHSNFGQVYTHEALQAARSALTNIQGRAVVPFADRQQFSALAAARKSTKTPPGFKDKGDGDFFVWADFLTGLRSAGRVKPFNKVLFLTDDIKPDWSRAGIAHPILRAEVTALLNKPFHVLTLKRFDQLIH